MKKKTKKLLMCTGITAAGAGAVTALSYRLTKNLVSLAMDRETPKLMSKSKSAASGGSHMSDVIERMDSAEEKLKNGDCETVEIVSDDGLRLVGHWHSCENPKRVIIAMHGWRSSWAKDFGVISDFWYENDCNVLYAEQRGQGESEGEYMTFGLLERYDCLAWINFVNEKTGGKLPIYLGGISMGATTVLMAAGLKLPENVKGIVADCGFTSSNEIWKHVTSQNMHIRYGKVRALFADSISKKKIAFGTNDYSTVTAMENCKVPVLFVHGTDDRFVPISMTYDNYKACAAEKRLLIVPEAEHGMSYLVNQRAYENAVKKMWRDYD